MIVLVLIVILAGSLAGAAISWLQGASFWGIVLGYVVGGWAGLLGGMPAVLALRALAGPCRLQGGKPGQGKGVKRQHPQAGNHVVMPPEDAVSLREPG